MFPEVATEWDYENNGSLTPDQIMYGSTQDIHWKCKFGHRWVCSPNTRTNKSTGVKPCPDCIGSFSNEKLTQAILNTIFPNITIINQFLIRENIYDDNILIRSKIFVDFAFYLKNKLILVEYNGAQHYQKINFGNFSEEKLDLIFKRQQLRDNFLRNYCIENNIELVEIDGRKIYGRRIQDFLDSIFKRKYITDYIK